MFITSSLSIRNADLAFECESSFQVNNGNLASVSFSGTSQANFFATSMVYAFESLPALTSIGGEILNGFGQGYSEIPSLYSAGEGGQYIPPALEYGFAYLQGMYSTGIMHKSSPGDGDAYLPTFTAIGGEGSYGFGSSNLPNFISLGSAGLGPLIAPLSTWITSSASLTTLLDHLIILNEEGQVVDTITGIREQIQAILAELELTDTYTVVGSLSLAYNENLVSIFNSLATIEDQPAFNSESRVWVVNLTNNASSQYENYGFVSFFEKDGVCYGIAEDGIYKLDGSTDEGSPINSLVEFGRSNFGITNRKTVQNVYLGVSSINKIFLKVDADETTYTYEARSNSDAIKNNRVDVGRGLRGNYFNFTLITDDTFELDSITFTPVTLSRRI